MLKRVLLAVAALSFLAVPAAQAQHRPAKPANPGIERQHTEVNHSRYQHRHDGYGKKQRRGHRDQRDHYVPRGYGDHPRVGRQHWRDDRRDLHHRRGWDNRPGWQRAPQRRAPPPRFYYRYGYWYM